MATPQHVSPHSNNFSLLHFNARLIKCKFQDIAAELAALNLLVDVISVTESWLSQSAVADIHSLPSYNSFHSYRNDKDGGGAAVFIR